MELLLRLAKLVFSAKIWHLIRDQKMANITISSIIFIIIGLIKIDLFRLLICTLTGIIVSNVYILIDVNICNILWLNYNVF